MFKTISAKYLSACQKIKSSLTPSASSIQISLVFLGFGLVAFGITQDMNAQGYTKVNFANYNDWRIAESTDIVLTYLNGAFGALIMVSCGIGAIVSGAFGQYRAALGLMVVAIGAFIVRSLVSTFFNDDSLIAQNQQ
jgi:hypothetical protein